LKNVGAMFQTFEETKTIRLLKGKRPDFGVSCEDGGARQ